MTDSTIIFETFLAPTGYKSYLYITEYVERYVKVPALLLNGETLEDFADGYTDAGFINTTSFMQLLSQRPCPVELIAAPLIMQDEDIPPTFFDIVVRKESTLMAMSDLHGCIWASYTRKSHVEDGRLYESAMPALDFVDIIETASQAQALRLLLDSKADATAIDARVMDIVRHNSPRIGAQLRTLGTYCVSPGPLVAIAAHVDSRLKQKIQEALLTMHLHPFYAQWLQEGDIERFIPVTNWHYQHARASSWKTHPTHHGRSEAEICMSASIL